MILGTICKLMTSGTDSLRVYGKLKKTLPFLVCPCSWNGRIVVIQEVLSKQHCIISLKSNEKLMSVCSMEDLKQLH